MEDWVGSIWGLLWMWGLGFGFGRGEGDERDGGLTFILRLVRWVVGRDERVELEEDVSGGEEEGKWVEDR